MDGQTPYGLERNVSNSDRKTFNEGEDHCLNSGRQSLHACQTRCMMMAGENN